MGCLSSAQASPPVVTINDRQQTTSSLPSKHSVPAGEHREQSWSLKEPSEEEIRISPQTDTKHEVFVLQAEDPNNDDKSSQSSLVLEVEKRTIEEFTHSDVETTGTENKNPPLESYEPEQKFSVGDDKSCDNSHTVPSTANTQRQFTEDCINGRNPKVAPPISVYKDSDDADSGFENPEIASVSAYSPEDPSDDEMF